MNTHEDGSVNYGGGGRVYSGLNSTKKLHKNS